MPLAANEVLLYPRRRRYIVAICNGFAGTKIHSRRERIYPFRVSHLLSQLMQRHAAEALPFAFPCVA